MKKMVKRNISVKVKNMPWDGSIKWMRIAAIIGFVLLAANVLIFSGVWFAGTFGTIINLALLVGCLFFYFGFAKLGKHTNSKLLKFSSLAIIISVIILAILVFILMKQTNALMFSALSGEGINSLEEGIGAITIPVSVYVLGIAAILVFLFFAVVNYLFYIGLIKIKDKIGLARVAGIIGLILITLILVVIIYTFYLALSGAWIGIFESLLIQVVSPYLRVLTLMITISLLLSMVSLFLESLVLLKGSEKFEK